MVLEYRALAVGARDIGNNHAKPTDSTVYKIWFIGPLGYCGFKPLHWTTPCMDLVDTRIYINWFWGPLVI